MSTIERPLTDEERKKLRRAFTTVRHNRRSFHDNTKWYSPRHVIHDLFALETFHHENILWECACGDNRLVEEMIKLGYKAVGSDKAQGHDFILDPSTKNRIVGKGVPCDIITNPPFDLATEFVMRAFDVAKWKIAMLLPLQYVAAQNRTKLFDDPPGGWKLAAIYPYATKPKFTRPDGTEKAMCRMWGSGEVAWYVWRKVLSSSEKDWPIISFKRITAKGGQP
jgi:hypothetical protein